jgi:hypothetical protein
MLLVHVPVDVVLQLLDDELLIVDYGLHHIAD